MRLYFLRLVLTVFLITALAGCSQSSKPPAAADGEDDGRIHIVSVIFPYYDFARAIAGDLADITMLVTPGASIHSFDPSPADIKKINDADVFLYTGGESDVWVERLLQSIDISNKKILKLIDYVDAAEEEDIEGENATDADEEIEYDEHIWTSPENAIMMINAIANCLCDIDSQNAEIYSENAERYASDIRRLDTELRDIVKSAKRNKIVVADKFPFLYFVREFGLDYRAAFNGCSDQTDASAKTIAELINVVQEEKIPFIYYVELSNKNVANAISEKTGADLLLLHSCQNVSLSEFNDNATYLSLMRQNAENLKKGLN